MYSSLIMLDTFIIGNSEVSLNLKNYIAHGGYIQLIQSCLVTTSLQQQTYLHRYHDPYYHSKANYLSNPDVEFMGVKTGSLIAANNAKVLKETRFRSAAVGDESLAPPRECP